VRISVVTSLFPSRETPHEGIFAQRRWAGMQQRGHDVAIVNPQPHAPWPLGGRYAGIRRRPARERVGGLDVARPRYFHVPGRAIGNARRFAKCALPLLFDAAVVVCDYAWPAAAIAPALAARGVPCVVNGRGSDVLEVAGEAGLGEHLARYLKSAGHWCAVSKDLVDVMDGLAGRPGRGCLVPNGVDDELFAPRDRRQCRAELALDAGLPLVLCVGHLIERKDPELALAAFLRGAPADAELVFIGRGPLEERLRSTIAASGAGARVRLLGEVEPPLLAQWVGAANAMLLTSRREGRPNVVLEALSAGLPVVATAAGGTAEILPPELLVRSRDADAIGTKLARVLADPPDPLSLRVGVAHLTWDASYAALEDCLRRATGAA
jgi:glycosyltransferase involved in cell wall biosynthesis